MNFHQVIMIQVIQEYQTILHNLELKLRRFHFARRGLCWGTEYQCLRKLMPRIDEIAISIINSIFLWKIPLEFRSCRRRFLGRRKYLEPFRGNELVFRSGVPSKEVYQLVESTLDTFL